MSLTSVVRYVRPPLEQTSWEVKLDWSGVSGASLYDIEFSGGGGAEDGNAPATESFETNENEYWVVLTGEGGQKQTFPQVIGDPDSPTINYLGYTGMTSTDPTTAGWQWRVRAKNNHGEGPWTEWTTGTFQPSSAASASAASVEYAANAEMQLSWSGGNNINEIEIQRSTSENSGYETIETFNSGFLASDVGSGFRESGTYTDTGVETGAAYFYRIITTNDSGVTGSTITSGTVGEGYQAPHAISGLTVSSAGAGSGQLNLNWTSPGYTGIGYTIQIYSGSGSAPTYALHTELTGSDAQGGLYSHTGLTSGVTYSYKLRAKDSSDNSGPYTDVVSGAAE